jgi:hypothetical protein
MDEIKRVSKKLHRQLLMDGDVLLSNKSAAALLRDAELELIKRAEKPVDLRTVPLKQWDSCVDRDIIIPDDMQELLIPDELLPRPFNEKIIHALERGVEKFHHVKPPYHIRMSITLQQTGRPWAYVPEAGQYLTGFILGKDDRSDDPAVERVAAILRKKAANGLAKWEQQIRG